MAPIQAIWAQDNRGVMVRVMGDAGDPATHLENRSGEPLANPYLNMASQIYAGLDGIVRKLDPGQPAEAPYNNSAEALPATLEEALAALRTAVCGPALVTISSTIACISRTPRLRDTGRKSLASRTKLTSPNGNTANISMHSDPQGPYAG
jgi:hypothetical protein